MSILTSARALAAIVVAAALLGMAPVVRAQEASAPATKPLAEVDALRLEKAEVEIQLLRERVERIREQAQVYVRDLARRDGVEGWQLDLPRRLWIKPPEQGDGAE